MFGCLRSGWPLFLICRTAIRLGHRQCTLSNFMSRGQWEDAILTAFASVVSFFGQRGFHKTKQAVHSRLRLLKQNFPLLIRSEDQNMEYILTNWGSTMVEMDCKVLYNYVSGMNVYTHTHTHTLVLWVTLHIFWNKLLLFWIFANYHG